MSHLILGSPVVFETSSVRSRADQTTDMANFELNVAKEVIVLTDSDGEV